MVRLCHGARLPIRAARHFHPSETGFSINHRKQWGGRVVPANEGSRQAGPTCLVSVTTAAGSGRLSLPDSCSRGPGVVRGWGNSTEQNRKPHFWSSGSERQVKSIRPRAHQPELSALEEGPAGQGRPLRGQHLNKCLQEGAEQHARLGEGHSGEKEEQIPGP